MRIASSRSWVMQRGLAHGLGQVQELVLQAAADQRVQRRERLVHQQDVGIGGERAGQADALLHAAGQFRRQAVAVTLQVHRLDHLLGHLGAGIGIDVAQFEREGDVVAHRAVR